MNFNLFNIIFIIVSIVVALIFIFTFFMMFSPKLKSKIMGQNIKATKYMLNDNEQELKDIVDFGAKMAEHSIKATKNIIDNNEQKLKDMATKSAEINRNAVFETAKAIKEGLTSDDNFIKCKYCGSLIDKDSNFCKKCGKKNI